MKMGITTQGQNIDTHRQLRQAWRALRYYTGKDHAEAIQQFEALTVATAHSIAKDYGLDSIEEAMPRALETLGVI